MSNQGIERFGCISIFVAMYVALQVYVFITATESRSRAGLS